MKAFILFSMLLVTTANAAVVTSVSEGGRKYPFSEKVTQYKNISGSIVPLTSGVDGTVWEHDGTIWCEWKEYTWKLVNNELVQENKGAVFKSNDMNESTVNVYDGEKLIVTINVN